MDYEKLFKFMDAVIKGFTMIAEKAKEEYEETGAINPEFLEYLNTVFQITDQTIEGGIDDTFIDQAISMFGDEE